MPNNLGGKRRGGPRRLIAGLRVTRQDEALLNLVRPLFPEADTEAELAYRLWRRGLEGSLAEAASFGVALPPGGSEELIAGLVAQRLLLAVPLLRRTGKLSILGLEVQLSAAPAISVDVLRAKVTGPEAIDDGASDAIAGLGGSEFL